MCAHSGKNQADRKFQLSGFFSIGAALRLALLAFIISKDQVYSETVLNQIEPGGVGPIWLVTEGKPTVSPRLSELLERVGPNMRASADYRDYRDVKLNESLEAWRVLHKQVGEYAHKQTLAQKANIIKLLAEANVSSECLRSSDETLDSMGRLESWAVQMWSYSGGFPPVASFAGHPHDMGSYKGCVDIARPSTESTSDNDSRQSYSASYCTVGFRPIIPVRPRFHLIFEQLDEQLTHLFNETNIMSTLTRQAQYFHYVYWKTGVCVPAACSSQDIQQVAKVVGRKLALMSAPVKCFSQAKLPMQTPIDDDDDDDLDNLENNKPVMVDLNRGLSSIQLVALLLVGAFFSVVFVATIWHGLELAWRELTTSRQFQSQDGLDIYGDEKGLNGRRLCNSSGLECDKNNNNNNKNNNNNRSHQLVTVSNHHAGSTLASTSQPPASTIHHQAPTKGSKEFIHRFRATLFDYFSMITNGREFCNTSTRANEIQCLHGLRVGTMLWIICVHVLQYNDWSGFTRVFENVPSLRNPIMHPVINANYVVDNFFLMSGLLVAYTTWHSQRGSPSGFSMAHALLGRYLRLTPQVLLISLCYIVLPSLGKGGPFWFDMTHYAGKYCEKNWWVNLLHLQAFYKEEEICNLVGWWISVDMFYYLIGLILVWMILNKRHRQAFACTGFLVGASTLITIYQHYTWGLSPNNLGLVPQVNEVWTEFVVKFFWSPYPHAYVFFLGLWLGYLMANKIGLQQVRRHAKLGWSLSLASFVAINLSSRLWLIGALELTTDQQVLSTSYNVVCVIGWASSFGWLIVACHYGCAPLLNKILSTRASIMLSKASFIIYLSHMLVIRAFYGSQYNLLEVSLSILVMLVSGITFLSILFGVFLCVAFEGPCMKIQRLILRKLGNSGKKPQPAAGLIYIVQSNNGLEATTAPEEKVILSAGAASVALFK